MEFSRPEYWRCSLSLLQGIFPTQGSNPGLLYCRWILYHLSQKGSPRMLEWVAYPFSGDLSHSGKRGLLHCRQICCQLSYQGNPSPFLENCKACQHITDSEKSCMKQPVWEYYPRSRAVCTGSRAQILQAEIHPTTAFLSIPQALK